MSLLAELNRRNVTRIAIAYMAAAWLLIQIADTLLPIYGFTDAAMRVLVAVLIVGFVAAVIFAWVFELTPEGLKKESEVVRSASITHHTGKKLDRAIIVVLALAVIFFAFDRLVLSESRIESAREEGRSAALVESYGDKSIAVLAFVDMSSAGDQEYMGDGVAEEILNLLAKVNELRVISRSSAFSYKGKDVDLRTIANELDVVHILEGSVRKAGNTIRITAQLIDARTDTHLWSETYDRELVDIFSIQDDIAASVVDELQATLFGDPLRSVKTNQGAYDLYLQARFAASTFLAPDLERAVELYEQALELDPNYVPAWVGKARTHMLMVSNGAAVEPNLASFREAIAEALRIDPDNAQARSMDSMFLIFIDGDLAGGAKQMSAALKLEPENVDILTDAAAVLHSLGRRDEAVDALRYVYRRDPKNTVIFVYLVEVLVSVNRLDEATAMVDAQIVLSPGSVNFNIQVLSAYLHFFAEDYDEVLRLTGEVSPEHFEVQQLQAVTHYALGNTEQYEASFSAYLRLHEQGTAGAIPDNLLWLYAETGQLDKAFEMLESDPVLANYTASALRQDPFYRKLRDDPRWAPLLEKREASQPVIEFEFSLPE